MHTEINTIVQQLFGKDHASQIEDGALEALLSRYPYLSVARYLAAWRKYRQGNDEVPEELVTAGLYINNPMWLQWLLENYQDPDASGAGTGPDPLTVTSDQFPITPDPFSNPPDPLSVTRDQLSDTPDSLSDTSDQLADTPEPFSDTSDPYTDTPEPLSVTEAERTEETSTTLSTDIAEESAAETLSANRDLASPEQPATTEESAADEIPSDPVHTPENPAPADAAAEPSQESTPANTSQIPPPASTPADPQTGSASGSTAHLPERAAAFDSPGEPPHAAAAERAPSSTAKTPGAESGEAFPIVFQSYHTIDYFASQGIRLQQADLTKDRFGQQLKSFTEWLRSMKKLPNTEAGPVMPEDPGRQQLVIRNAASSLEDREVYTEAMAEVWAKQGNAAKARSIYEKLSLLNPSKSTYFAAKIDQLKAV